MAIPLKLTIRLDAKLREALTQYVDKADMNPSAAVRVLLSQALTQVGVTDIDAQNAVIAEARRELRAHTKQVLERVLHELENG